MEIPKCINGNTAINICTSEDCNHPNPFICANCLNNQCNQLHEDCITPQWNKTKNTIEKSKKLNAPDFIKISNAVQQTILKAMKYLQKQLEYFNDWKSTFGMPNEAVNLFRCIKNNQEHKFTGMQISRILKDLKREHEIKKLNEEMIKQQMNEVLSQMEQTQKMIRQIYSIWDQELSLEIKQQLLDNLYWMSDCSQKPSDLKIKCNKIGIQGQILLLMNCLVYI